MSGIIQSLIGSLKSAAATATDAYYNLVTLLLNTSSTNGAQNNTFLDSSSNNFTITRNGNTTQGTFTPFSQTGWGNNFNGSTDYISAGTSLFNYTTANASTQTATIEAWVYTTAYGSPSQTYYSECIIGKGDVYMNFGINGSGNLVLTHFDGTQRTVTSSGTVSLNTWTYVACTISGGVVTLYINGSSSGTGTWFGIAAGGQNTASLIGRASTNASSIYFSGYLSNVRVSTNVRTITTPTIAYSSDGNTALLTCQSNRFVDNSSNAYALTLTGTPSVQAFSPFLPTAAYSTTSVGGSGYFDGTGDYITLPNNSIPLSNSDFTVELWVYPLTNTKANVVGGQGDAATAAGSSFVFYVNTATTSDLYVGSTSYAVTSPTAPINQWSHVAYVRTGGTFSSYLNGTRVSTIATLGTSSVNAGSTTYPPSIGAYASNQFLLNGYISSCRLITGSGGYNATSSTITIPTAPLTNVTNTKFLTNFTNAGIYDAAAKNDLETVGNAQVSTTQAKFGTTSMYFDGSGDYLYSPVSSSNILGNTWTIEFWYQPTSRATTYPAIICISDSNSNYANTISIFDRHQSATTKFSFCVANAGTISSGTTNVSNGTWYHIALVSNNGSNTLYINGTSEATSSTTTGSANKAIFVGINFDFATYGSALNGYIDELRITKGVARYTANFTAPTSAFPIQ